MAIPKEYTYTVNVKGKNTTATNSDTVTTIATIDFFTTKELEGEDFPVLVNVGSDLKMYFSRVEAVVTIISKLTKALITEVEIVFSLSRIADTDFVPSNFWTSLASNQSRVDPLEPSDIFADEYTDTTVTPVLQITAEISGSETTLTNIKQIGDPNHTSGFTTQLQNLISKLAEYSQNRRDTETEIADEIRETAAADITFRMRNKIVES